MRFSQTACFYMVLMFSFDLTFRLIPSQLVRTIISCVWGWLVPFCASSWPLGDWSIAIADGPMQHIKASDSRPDAAIHLAHRGVLWRLILCPNLAFGESYMDGDLQIELGKIDDLLALPIANNNQRNRH